MKPSDRSEDAAQAPCDLPGPGCQRTRTSSRRRPVYRRPSPLPVRVGGLWTAGDRGGRKVVDCGAPALPEVWDCGTPALPEVWDCGTPALPGVVDCGAPALPGGVDSRGPVLP